MTTNDTATRLSDTLMIPHEQPAADPADPTSRPAGHPTRYRDRWRAVPGSLAYLVGILPVGIASFALLLAFFVTGAVLLITLLGVFVLAACLYLAGAFAGAERGMLAMAGRPPIAPPVMARPKPDANRWQRALTGLRDPHRWVALLHGLLIAPVLGLAMSIIAITWTAVSFGGITSPIWYPIIPDKGYVWGHDVNRFLPILEPLGGHGTETLLQVVAGVLFLLVLPWLLSGMVRFKYELVKAMLGRWQSDDLRAEVASLAASRGAAVQAEDHAVRRLERDLHDGPQQRLMRLQMDLSAIERSVEQDPAAAKELIAEARDQGQAVLDELRALAAGMAPPLLQDRGLAVALEALVARSPLWARGEIDLDPEVTLPSEVERSAYFIVAELITNAARHSGASGLTVRAYLQDGESGTPELVVQVGDDGQGGARVVPGHGISGLHERAQGLRGSLWIDSPEGGPTWMSATLPLH